MGPNSAHYGANVNSIKASHMSLSLHDLSEVQDAFTDGRFVIVHDPLREEEGDFFLLAKHATPEKINFLLQRARGMICVACDQSILKRLDIPFMVPPDANSSEHGTNFGLLVDAKEGITTGVSAADRCTTIQKLATPETTADDFIRPGHTAPLHAMHPSKRWGHTEAAVQLAKSVNEYPVVVICEVLNERGEKASTQELIAMSEEWDMPMTTLEELRKTLPHEITHDADLTF